MVANAAVAAGAHVVVPLHGYDDDDEDEHEAEAEAEGGGEAGVAHLTANAATAEMTSPSPRELEMRRRSRDGYGGLGDHVSDAAGSANFQLRCVCTARSRALRSEKERARARAQTCVCVYAADHKQARVISSPASRLISPSALAHEQTLPTVHGASAAPPLLRFVGANGVWARLRKRRAMARGALGGARTSGARRGAPGCAFCALAGGRRSITAHRCWSGIV
jgi:hypothetical protein